MGVNSLPKTVTRHKAVKNEVRRYQLCGIMLDNDSVTAKQ